LDPIAHTFAGAALAAAGLKRATPLATAALLIGANAPDVDGIAYFGGEFGSLAFRRGWTHGVLALALWPLLLTGLLLLWDRFVRLRRAPNAAPARAEPLLGLTTLAVLTHPTLDWLNNYGLRWLMPFDGRWFYGDAVFIIDPWLWLVLGGVAFAAYSASGRALAAWCAFWVLASVLVLATADVPLAARALWVIGVVAAFMLRRWLTDGRDAEAALRFAARAALAVAAVYVGTLATVDGIERSLVRAELAARGRGAVEDVMVAPVAANPFAGEVVVATADSYYVGRWDWLATPRLVLNEAAIPKRTAEPIFAAAAQTPGARRFLTWARFPYVEVAADADGHVVRFFDARYYATGRLMGPTVRLDRNLTPVER
jgi:inner membrane protein